VVPERRERVDTGVSSTTRVRFSATRFFAAASRLTLLERVETGIQGVLPASTSDEALNFTSLQPTYIFFKICGNKFINNMIVISPYMLIFHFGM